MSDSVPKNKIFDVNKQFMSLGTFIAFLITFSSLLVAVIRFQVQSEYRDKILADEVNELIIVTKENTNRLNKSDIIDAKIMEKLDYITESIDDIKRGD